MIDYNKIITMYNSIESSELDISTERLLQQTADCCRVTVDEVVAILEMKKDEEYRDAIFASY